MILERARLNKQKLIHLNVSKKYTLIVKMFNESTMNLHVLNVIHFKNIFK